MLSISIHELMNRLRTTSLLLLVSLVCTTLSARAQRVSEAPHRVVVNGVLLPSEAVAALDRQYRVHIQDGRYWYDCRSGAWGFEGGPTVGFIPAGLHLGGSLRRNASRGDTGVFVNGRELPVQDLLALQQLVGYVGPGRYWLDAWGNAGVEGGPTLVNLAERARQAGGGGNNAFYRSGNTDYGAGSSGGTSYVMGEDWSVILDH